MLLKLSKLQNLYFLPLIDFVVCVSSNLFFRKLELIIFGANSLIISEYFFPRDSN